MTYEYGAYTLTLRLTDHFNNYIFDTKSGGTQSRKYKRQEIYDELMPILKKRDDDFKYAQLLVEFNVFVTFGKKMPRDILPYLSDKIIIWLGDMMFQKLIISDKEIEVFDCVHKYLLFISTKKKINTSTLYELHDIYVKYNCEPLFYESYKLVELFMDYPMLQYNEPHYWRVFSPEMKCRVKMLYLCIRAAIKTKIYRNIREHIARCVYLSHGN
jgi:hypothetical protein